MNKDIYKELEAKLVELTLDNKQSTCSAVCAKAGFEGDGDALAAVSLVILALRELQSVT